MYISTISFFFFFNDTATTEIYTLSLHDALPISAPRSTWRRAASPWTRGRRESDRPARRRRAPPAYGRAPSTADRKSTRLNSSHLVISYAVFCLKKKKTQQNNQPYTPSHEKETIH